MTGPPPARMPVDHVVHRRCGRDDVVAVDRDVVDAVSRGALLERRRVLRRRRARTRRTRCSRRRRRPAASTPRPGSPLRGTCPCATAPSPKNATATRAVGAQLRGGRGARPRSGGPRPRSRSRRRCRSWDRRCASSRRARGSCPGPSPSARRTSRAASRPFARQWPWPRWVDVITSVGPSGQHAPTADASCPIDRCTKPGTSPSRYSAATRCSNPRITSMRRCIVEEVGVAEHEPCIVLTGTNQGARCPNQIDLPVSNAVSVT